MKFSRRINSLIVTISILVTIVQVLPIAANFPLLSDKTKLKTTLTKCLLDKDSFYIIQKVPFYVSGQPPQSRKSTSISPDCPDIIRSYLQGDYNLYNSLGPSDTIDVKSPIKNVRHSHHQLINLDVAPGKQKYRPFLDDGRFQYYLMLINSHPAEFKAREFSNKDPLMNMELSESKTKLSQNLNDKDYLSGYLVDNPLDKQEERLKRSDMSRRAYTSPLESGLSVKRMYSPTAALLETVADREIQSKMEKIERNRAKLLRYIDRAGK